MEKKIRIRSYNKFDIIVLRYFYDFHMLNHRRRRWLTIVVIVSSIDALVKMASTEVDKCTNYPEFAVVCSFIEKFGEKLSANLPNIGELQSALEETDEGNLRVRHCCQLSPLPAYHNIKFIQFL